MRIGLVLSGGMAKGAYQVGALKALNEYIPREEIQYMSCSSIGALNGYAYATDQLELAEELWCNLCGNLEKMSIAQVLRNDVGYKCVSKAKMDVASLPSRFYITLVDITHMTMVYRNLRSVAQSNLLKYMHAGISMPLYNRPVQINNVKYYDGAMVDDIPVYPLLKHKLDYVICIYFDNASYKFESGSFDDKVIRITFPLNNFVKDSFTFRSNMLTAMVDDGYRIAKEIFDKVFATGYEDTEAVLNNISEINKDFKSRKIRITGDVVVGNLNKIVQHFAKRKVER